ncbi:MAG TPA: M23 family metallopeptidase [Bryobacteraceae bacterium]|nr:M23 family metallopeptidase [Bryobacteraceae bacterium]
MKIAVGAVLALILIVAIAMMVMSTGTALAIRPAVQTIGISTPVTVEVVNPHGVRRVTAYLEQNGSQYPVYEQQAPAHRFFWRRHEPVQRVSFDVGRNKAPNLKEGKARLVVEAVSDDLRGDTDQTASDVTVVLAPPRVTADDFQHYINQAGMELVTFTVTGSWSEAGVKVGQHTFRSFPLPGRGPDQRFAMFAYPWDAPPDLTPVVYARNAAGTEVTGRFWFKLFPKKFRERDFVLTDQLMDKLVNNIDSAGTLEPGPDMLTRFVKINSDLRKKNNQQLYDLRTKTEEKILWNGPFIHWGKEEAMFADTRDYKYNGKQVDRQTHLGFDLSDVANGPVHAANSGKVVYAADLGIYGNCVVLDHGYGLQSIYGHMQRIDVKVGDMVEKDGKLGIAGSTGLAEGVHVHFGMQIDGVQINPREWWDEHWIHDRILSKLAPER